MRVSGKIAREAKLLGERQRFRRERPGSTAEGADESYRFWHLDYGSTPYYDQWVFKRHAVIPPRHPSQRLPPTG